MPSTTAAGSHRWVGVPADERRAERRRLLVDAAFELLGTDGDAGTTVRAVCAATRLNPRYFYESFADRDALLLAVYDQQVAELGELLASRLAEVGDDEAAFTRTGIDTVVRFVAEDPPGHGSSTPRRWATRPSPVAGSRPSTRSASPSPSWGASATAPRRPARRSGWRRRRCWSAV